MGVKRAVAGQVNTAMKQVASLYLGQTENDAAVDVADKFQSLVRQVMNTDKKISRRQRDIIEKLIDKELDKVELQ